MAHHFRDLMGHAGVDPALNLAECFGNEAASFGRVQLRSIEAAGIIDHAGSVKKGRVVKIGLVCRVCELQQVIFIQ